MPGTLQVPGMVTDDSQGSAPAVFAKMAGSTAGRLQRVERRLWRLHQAQDVAIGIDNRGDQLATTNISDRLLGLCT